MCHRFSDMCQGWREFEIRVYDRSSQLAGTLRPHMQRKALIPLELYKHTFSFRSKMPFRLSFQPERPWDVIIPASNTSMKCFEHVERGHFLRNVTATANQKPKLDIWRNHTKALLTNDPSKSSHRNRLFYKSLEWFFPRKITSYSKGQTFFVLAILLQRVTRLSSLLLIMSYL